MTKFEGPYGVIETDELIPRWTFPCDGTIKQVESGWMLGDMSNAVTEVRKERAIHKIHKQDYDYGNTFDEIDLDESAEAIQKTASRLLIRPELGRLRSRGRQADSSSENVFEVNEETVDGLIDDIEDSANSFRKMFLSQTIPQLLGYDIAAGEAEAVVRDMLKTDIEIDDELVSYIGKISLADMIGKVMKDSKNIPEAVLGDVLKDFLIKSFDGVRVDALKNHKSGLLRRLKSEYSNLIAEGKMPTLGTSRGLSQVRNGQET